MKIVHNWQCNLLYCFDCKEWRKMRAFGLGMRFCPMGFNHAIDLKPHPETEQVNKKLWEHFRAIQELYKPHEISITVNKLDVKHSVNVGWSKK